MAASTSVYHEKQRLRCCALHTVNNILQCGSFTKADFDNICLELDRGSCWFNAHRDFWGTGNYDVNVIMRAFSMKRFEIRWFDRRKDPQTISVDAISGLVANRRTGGICGLFDSRHWFAIAKIGADFYNCDSTLESPRRFASTDELFTFLREDVIEDGRGEVLLVVAQYQEIPPPSGSESAGPDPLEPPSSASDVEQGLDDEHGVDDDEHGVDAEQQ